jgi:hypothetical protein
LCCGRAKKGEKETELGGKKEKTDFSFIPQIRTAPGKVGQKWRVPGGELSNLRTCCLHITNNIVPRIHRQAAGAEETRTVIMWYALFDPLEWF